VIVMTTVVAVVVVAIIAVAPDRATSVEFR
jgi:hypothetical protein